MDALLNFFLAANSDGISTRVTKLHGMQLYSVPMFGPADSFLTHREGPSGTPSVVSRHFLPRRYMCTVHCRPRRHLKSIR